MKSDDRVILDAHDVLSPLGYRLLPHGGDPETTKETYKLIELLTQFLKEKDPKVGSAALAMVSLTASIMNGAYQEALKTLTEDYGRFNECLKCRNSDCTLYHVALHMWRVNDYKPTGQEPRNPCLQFLENCQK